MLTGFDMIMGSDHEKKGQDLPGRKTEDSLWPIEFDLCIRLKRRPNCRRKAGYRLPKLPTKQGLITRRFSRKLLKKNSA